MYVVIIYNMQAAYLVQLGAVFEDAERQQNFPVLTQLYEVYKLLFSCSNRFILMNLVSKRFYLHSFGALECK